jgi:ketosteroid isomerase-like protein
MRTWMWVALAACAATWGGYAQETSDSDVGSKIVALENLWNQAVEARDLKALDAILDDAFVNVDAEGKILTKAEVLADVKGSRGVRVSSEAMVVHLHGDTAVVTGIYQLSGAERGKPFVRRQRFVDTWRYKSGIWVSIASLATPLGS